MRHHIAIVVLIFVECCTSARGLAQFTTIYNSPPDTIPDSVGSNTQVNSYVGGGLPFRFASGAYDGSSSNVEINVFGAEVGPYFNAYGGSTVNISGGYVSGGFVAHAGAVVNVSGGTIEDGFSAMSDTTVNVRGGAVGDNFVVAGTLNMTGGTVDGFFEAEIGSVLNLRGGSMGTTGEAWGGYINLAGGSIGQYFTAEQGSIVDISHGSVGDQFVADAGSTILYSGGSIGQAFYVSHQVTLDVFGKSFSVNGVPLNISPGHSLVLTNRDVTLSGVLVDGSSFSFPLNSAYEDNAYHFDTDAQIILTRGVPGDYNHNGIVDAADYTVWRDSASQYVDNGTGADGTLDGLIDDADYRVWQAHFGQKLNSGSASSTTSVPEPATVLLLTVAGFGIIACRRSGN